METVTRSEAGKLTGKDPEAIRRAIMRGELTEVALADGRKAITYESLCRYAAERRVGDFFLSRAEMSDGSLDDVAPAFWAALGAKLGMVACLRQIHTDARGMSATGRADDARVAHEWAALAEFAEIVIPTEPGAPWRVRLPAAGLMMPIPPHLVGEVQQNAMRATAPNGGTARPTPEPTR
ncbi:MAG: hypothetical protein MUE41_04120 [Gemmatimonadaceae bacterium]|nr:hypothetical protein [Gemmatimonadaceae bacterium]